MEIWGEKRLKLHLCQTENEFTLKQILLQKLLRTKENDYNSKVMWIIFKTNLKSLRLIQKDPNILFHLNSSVLIELV